MDGGNHFLALNEKNQLYISFLIVALLFVVEGPKKEYTTEAKCTKSQFYLVLPSLREGFRYQIG